MKWFQINNLSPWTMPVAFAVKSLVAVLFLYLYTYVLGDGNLSEDAMVFMNESATLHEVFWKSPSAYFKFLTGIGENQELIQLYLTETTHWDIGEQSIINDNKNILRVHSLLHFISFGSAMIHALFFSFIGLIGVQQLFLAIRNTTKVNPNIVFWLLLLLPSALFWTSSVLKEPFMLLGLGLLLRALFSTTATTRKKLILGGIGALLLLGFKPYVLIALLPMLLFVVVAKRLPKHAIIGSLGILVAMVALLFALFPNQRDRTLQRISRKQFDFANVARGGVHVHADSIFYYFSPEQRNALIFEGDSVTLSEAVDAQILQLGLINAPIPVHLEADGKRWPLYFQNRRSNGFIETTPIRNSWSRLLKNIPEALINTLFRPFPGDGGGKANWLAIMEYSALFIGLGWAIVRRRQLNKIDRIHFIGLFLFAFSFSLFIGWTTPVIGAIVRYRIPVYLVLLMSILLIIAPSKKRKT